MLTVNEIFHSIQGESTHAGRPCVFVRLTGCNLRCRWCDSEYTFTGVPGRYYKVYRSDDAADGTHLQKWVDNGTPSTTGIGPHSFQVSQDPAEPRRYYRVHVMQADGPWPAAYP